MGLQGENRAKKAGNGEAAGGTDIIIVGAGVAGSALAYALGKVYSSVSLGLHFLVLIKPSS